MVVLVEIPYRRCKIHIYIYIYMCIEYIELFCIFESIPDFYVVIDVIGFIYIWLYILEVVEVMSRAELDRLSTFLFERLLFLRKRNTI